MPTEESRTDVRLIEDEMMRREKAARLREMMEAQWAKPGVARVDGYTDWIDPADKKAAKRGGGYILGGGERP
jgi:hypothetical protein